MLKTQICFTRLQYVNLARSFNIVTAHLLLLWLYSKSTADYSVVEFLRSSFGERQRAKDSNSECRAKFPTASIIKTLIGTECSPRCHATPSVDISWTSSHSSCIYHASRDTEFRTRVLHIQPINLIYRQLRRTLSCPCDHDSGIVSSLLQISKYS